MAAAPKFSNPKDNEIVRRARANCDRDSDDNAMNEASLIAEVERLMPFNAVVERHKKAARMVRAESRPGKTESDGSLWLPGFEPIAYEPEQLIPDGAGKTVERDLATAYYVSAALERASENLRKQQRAFRLKQFETDEFSVWAMDQSIAGRASNEITFGNFVRERGFWRQDPIEGDDEDHGED